MKTTLDYVEQYAMHTALCMFLLLCAVTAVQSAPISLSAIRDMVFLLTGISGVIIAGQLGAVLSSRIGQTKKRTVRIAQALLLGFSLIMALHAMLGLGLLASLARWD